MQKNQAAKTAILKLYKVITIALDYTVELELIDSNPAKDINQQQMKCLTFYRLHDRMVGNDETLCRKNNISILQQYSKKCIGPYFLEKKYTLTKVEGSLKYI
ncbi:hypothetical protein [Tissierella pigra]|uniref:hypothetical protein n=1 Tax=Tissierella pigra TaxID=2607614 RepID=UPI0018A6B817|nr:hypothetical protein [Tissierella pigra]